MPHDPLLVIASDSRSLSLPISICPAFDIKWTVCQEGNSYPQPTLSH